MKKQQETRSAAGLVVLTALAAVGISAVLAEKSGIKQVFRKKALDDMREIEKIDKQMEALFSENAALRQNLELLSASLDKMTVQNDKLLTANNALAIALEEEHDRVLKLMNVISDDSTEKLALARKLEEAYQKLARTGYSGGRQGTAVHSEQDNSDANIA